MFPWNNFGALKPIRSSIDWIVMRKYAKHRWPPKIETTHSIYHSGGWISQERDYKLTRMPDMAFPVKSRLAGVPISLDCFGNRVSIAGSRVTIQINSGSFGASEVMSWWASEHGLRQCDAGFEGREGGVGWIGQVGHGFCPASIASVFYVIHAHAACMSGLEF